MQEKYVHEAQQGILHVAGHFEKLKAELPVILDRIQRGDGNLDALVCQVLNFEMASGLLAWFRDRDLVSFLLHFDIAARIDRSRSLYGFLFRPSRLVLAAAVGNNSILDWFSRHPSLPGLNERDIPSSWDFQSYQILLAIGQDWGDLRDRANRFLQQVPSRQQKVKIDNEFFRALASGAVLDMTRALQELTSPKIARYRNRDVLYSFAAPFIASDAVTYYRIAQRAGFELAVQTPYIPMDWMTAPPLTPYDMPYEFVCSFEASELEDDNTGRS